MAVVESLCISLRHMEKTPLQDCYSEKQSHSILYRSEQDRPHYQSLNPRVILHLCSDDDRIVAMSSWIKEWQPSNRYFWTVFLFVLYHLECSPWCFTIYVILGCLHNNPPYCSIVTICSAWKKIYKQFSYLFFYVKRWTPLGIPVLVWDHNLESTVS